MFFFLSPLTGVNHSTAVRFVARGKLKRAFRARSSITIIFVHCHVNMPSPKLRILKSPVLTVLPLYSRSGGALQGTTKRSVTKLSRRAGEYSSLDEDGRRACDELINACRENIPIFVSSVVYPVCRKYVPHTYTRNVRTGE